VVEAMRPPVMSATAGWQLWEEERRPEERLVDPLDA